MIPRLDLMVDEERRYQGPVSVPFIIRAGGVSLAVAVGMMLLNSGYRAYVIGRDLRAAEANWARIKPRHEAVQRSNAALTLLTNCVGEIEGWQRARLSVGLMMDKVERLIPANIQLVRVEYRDDLEAPSRTAGAKPAGPDLARSLKIRIAGRAHEPDARGEIEGLISRLKDLRPEGATNALLHNVELQSVQSVEVGGAAGSDAGRAAPVYEFEIVARGEPRAVK